MRTVPQPRAVEFIELPTPIRAAAYDIDEYTKLIPTDLNPRTREILVEMARIAYLIDRYREGIAAKSRRYTELEGELAAIEAPP